MSIPYSISIWRTEYSTVGCTPYVISTARRHTATALAPFPPPQPQLMPTTSTTTTTIQHRFFVLIPRQESEQKQSQEVYILSVYYFYVFEWFWIVITLTVSAVKPTTLRLSKVHTLPFSSPLLSASHSLVSPYLYLCCLSVAPFSVPSWTLESLSSNIFGKKSKGRNKNKKGCMLTISVHSSLGYTLTP